MLLRQSLSYLIARGLPGFVNFLAIAVYTRVLPPEEYGRYALIVAGVGFLNVIFFQWLRASLLRFLPAHLDDPGPLVSTLVSTFRVLSLSVGGIGLLVAWLWPLGPWRGLIALSIPLLCAEAWFELNLEVARSQLQPLRYGLLAGVKSVSALVLGTLAAFAGAGAFGPLLGVLLGTVLAGFLYGTLQWRNVPCRPSPLLLRDFFRYGMPLTATFALSFIVSASDRFLIAWLLDESQVGVYAACYDLSQQTVILLMMVVNLAAYPVALRALEREGQQAARRQLTQNAILLIAVGLPATTGLAVLAPNVAYTLLGRQFQENAPYLIALVGVAALLSGTRSYYFDLAFQFERRTLSQVWIMGAAACLNVLLNLLLIPMFGVAGAAYATLAAYMLALGLSVVLGRRAFHLPVPIRDWVKIAMASLGCAVLLLPTLDHRGAYALAGQVLLGGFAYLALMAVLNPASCRSRARG